VLTLAAVLFAGVGLAAAHDLVRTGQLLLAAWEVLLAAALNMLLAAAPSAVRRVRRRRRK
jgi:hypothetical protein